MKDRYIFSGVFGMFAALIAGCYFYYHYVFIDKFNRDLYTHAQNTNGAPIKLSELTDFEWDEVTFLGITTEQDIKKYLAKEGYALVSYAYSLSAHECGISLLFKNKKTKKAYVKDLWRICNLNYNSSHFREPRWNNNIYLKFKLENKELPINTRYTIYLEY